MAANINLGKLAFVPPSPSTIPFRSPIGTLKASDPVESDDVVTLGVLGNATTPLKQYGILPWSALTDYPTNGLAMGLDGAIYQALQPSGPGNGGAQQPTSNSYWVSLGAFGDILTKSFSKNNPFFNSGGAFPSLSFVNITSGWVATDNGFRELRVITERYI